MHDPKIAGKIYDLEFRKALFPRYFSQSREVFATGREIAPGVWIYDGRADPLSRRIKAMETERRKIDPNFRSQYDYQFIFVSQTDEVSLLMDEIRASEVWELSTRDDGPRPMSLPTLKKYLREKFFISLDPTLADERQRLLSVLRQRVRQLWAAERRR